MIVYEENLLKATKSTLTKSGTDSEALLLLTSNLRRLCTTVN